MVYDLEGVLQTVNNRHNGRIYDVDLFSKYVMKHYMNKLRKQKIKRIFNV
jgi:hypothetical protein